MKMKNKIQKWKCTNLKHISTPSSQNWYVSTHIYSFDSSSFGTDPMGMINAGNITNGIGYEIF